MRSSLGGHHCAHPQLTLASATFLSSRALEFISATERASPTIPALDRKFLVETDRLDSVNTVSESQDVGCSAAPPLVDRLVVVANHAQIRPESSKGFDQPFLDWVRVLVLIDTT